MLVHADVADAFISGMKTAIKGFYEGNPKTSPWYGRLINDAAFERLSKCIDDARERVVLGGDSDASERYIAPTIIDLEMTWTRFQNLRDHAR